MAAVIKLEKRVDFVTEYMSMEDLAGSIWKCQGRLSSLFEVLK